MQHGQPIDPAERDRLLRLPITLPSNYLRTAVQQFQVDSRLLISPASLQSLESCMCMFAVHLCLLPKGISSHKSRLIMPVAAHASLFSMVRPCTYVQHQYIAVFVKSLFTLENSLCFDV